MAEVAAGVGYVLKNVVEGAALVAKGIYDPTLPLKATIRPITSIDLPRAHHSVSLIKGRAYIFGGKTLGEDGGVEGALADNGMHVVILPTSGIESTDYKLIGSSEPAGPAPRWGHSAEAIGDRIYIFGGCGADDEPLEEQGRVWIFDTVAGKWSHLDPSADGRIPDSRTNHASVASELPRPVVKRPDEGSLPQAPPDPEDVHPQPLDPESYGTVIVQGGLGKSGAQLNDIWRFDMSSRTWSELPRLPHPGSGGPSLALVDRRLYAFSAGQTSYLALMADSTNDRAGVDELGLLPAGEWQTLSSPPSNSPEISHPGERSGAALVPVTTGQGRNYLLLIAGSSLAGEVLEDMWTLQLEPEGMTAASLKDAARLAIRKDTNEARWSEVRYHDAEGVLIQEGQTGRGVGVRKGCAIARGAEIDGASLLVWGGISEDERIRSDGLIISLER